MTVSDHLVQYPSPGVHFLQFRGDTFTFTLHQLHPREGTAWLRTNIGHAEITRREVIREVIHAETPLARDWYDIPMQPAGEGRFQVTVPLRETGHFEAKCYFLPEGETTPEWPEGPNTALNVAPADTCCANILYNAFVRLFGPGKAGEGAPSPEEKKCVASLDAAQYTVIPESGTFRDMIGELDFIINTLGCRYIQLLPVHPTPTTYARMGRFGSPYAALNFREVDPALAEFDPGATPLDQFRELVDAIHARHGRVLMDIAINHTGWAASIHESHPEWLARTPDGHIERPGAWGVIWEDLTRLDYRHKGLWQYIADVFLTWCSRGADGFRCDAGYMIPLDAWRYIIATVRNQYPDTIFFLEGLGGKISVTRDLLNIAGMEWAYSELFQNYDRGQIEQYMPEAQAISRSDGLMIHYAETHDNNRLAARSHAYARMRTAFCALFSPNGGFGFANGVEWLATEKIDVHGAPSLNWGAEENQVADIRKLTALLTNHPAFHEGVALTMRQKGAGNGVVLLRHHAASGKKLLILINLADTHATRLTWDAPEMAGPAFTDLLTGETVQVETVWDGQSLELGPGRVFCLSDDPADLQYVRPVTGPPPRALTQRFQAKALDVFCHYNGVGNMDAFDPDAAVRQLSDDPEVFCRKLNPAGGVPEVILWDWPTDLRREVMVPPGFFLLLRTPRPFRARIVDGNRTVGQEEALPCKNGGWFILFPPLPAPSDHRPHTLKLRVYGKDGCESADAPLLYLSDPQSARVKQVFHRQELLRTPLLFLGTNGRGGMARAHVNWGHLASRYDALLGANLHPDFPEDRHIMLARCRGWVVYQGFSYEIGLDCLEEFRFDGTGAGFWQYHIPTGQGEDIRLTIGMEMIPDRNAVQILFFRHKNTNGENHLPDHQPVRLILRPDIEDRNFHSTTKAFAGPEQTWPGCIQQTETGFTFSPSPDRRLQVTIDKGQFALEPEWQYMIHRPVEAVRGLDPDSDLYSPGYFSAFLEGGISAVLSAQVLTGEPENQTSLPPSRLAGMLEKPFPALEDLEPALRRAIAPFVVRREKLSTVIAGYPWFLDWGRDTLIFVRGLIAAGRTETARDILKQFAHFEENGTLPNMIRGNDAGNRDTSDAPLWFFIGCADLLNMEGDDAFLDEPCNGRTIREILVSIGQSFRRGTPNGIVMDAASGLIFSPSHFTWMDTNHPAGTPREGYPIEIQAFWHFALSFLARIDPDAETNGWEKLAGQVNASITELFFLEEKGFLSDCLHALPGTPARQAVADDALRPNQLFALTTGAVTEPAVCRRILRACMSLLVPGAIRSLADRPVEHPLEVRHQGHLLNDPDHPYQGYYMGDEDTRRKPAYHNGTAWSWVFPSFCEAWYGVYGKNGRAAALAWLAGATKIINAGCAGQVPEVLDGNAPHLQRGCDAQAWGASELLRVWLNVRDSRNM